MGLRFLQPIERPRDEQPKERKKNKSCGTNNELLVLSPPSEKELDKLNSGSESAQEPETERLKSAKAEREMIILPAEQPEVAADDVDRLPRQQVVGICVIPRFATNPPTIGIVGENKMPPHEDAELKLGFVFGGVDEGDISLRACGLRELAEELVTPLPDSIEITPVGAFTVRNHDQTPSAPPYLYFAIYTVDLPAKAELRLGTEQVRSSGLSTEEINRRQAKEQMYVCRRTEKQTDELIEQCLFFPNHARAWRIYRAANGKERIA